MGFFDFIKRENRSSPDVQWSPEVGITQATWDALTPEQRAIIPWNVYGDDDIGSKTTSGSRVSETTSLNMSIVYAAVTLVADGVASLPPRAFTEAADGTRTGLEVPQWIRRPHPEIRRFDVFGQLLVSSILWGNGYAQLIRRPSDGIVVGMQVLDPAEVYCEWDPDKNGYRRYRVNGSGPWLTSQDIFHIQGPTLPGEPTGMSVIRHARESIGLGLTLEEYGARYFGQGSQAKVVIELPNGNIDAAKAKDIIATFERFHKGKNNWHRPAVVSGGAKLHTISIPPDDAQFLQSRDFQAVEIARWFRVPPHRVGVVSKSTSWGSGLAEENMAMLQHTYRPWIIRLQDALTAYAPGSMDSGTMIELDTAALLQGTFKEQADIWVGMFEKQIVTKNEARQKLGLPKVDGGDEFMTPPEVEAAGQATNPNSPGSGGRTKEQDRLRKQEEAKRSLFDDIDNNDFYSLTDPFGDDDVEFRKVSNSAGSPNHDSKGRFASKPGMSAATPERKAEFKDKFGRTIPPAWTDVQIADDLDKAPLLVIGRDSKGRGQSIYSEAHTKAQAEKKFTRIKELSTHTDKLDAALDRDALTNDDAGALTLIRRLGMRPGSNSNTQANVQAHGATNLKSKHVRFEDGAAVLDFTGKDGVHIVLKTRDPKVLDVLQSRKIGKGDDDQLFNTNEERVRKYFRTEGGVPQQFLLKDLRTMHANTVALKEVSKVTQAPATKQEFLSKRKEIATTVSAQLGNNPTMALNSYINPTVFGSWVKDPSWLT